MRPCWFVGFGFTAILHRPTGTGLSKRRDVNIARTDDGVKSRNPSQRGHQLIGAPGLLAAAAGCRSPASRNARVGRDAPRTGAGTGRGTGTRNCARDSRPHCHLHRQEIAGTFRGPFGTSGRAYRRFRQFCSIKLQAQRTLLRAGRTRQTYANFESDEAREDEP